jgi:uncharacterized protein DUF4431
MRLPAFGFGVAMSCLAAITAQADCLKANTPDQTAEGRLISVIITIEDYKKKEQAYILRLDADACLDGTDDYDKVEVTRRIHVFATDDALRRKLRLATGKMVRVSGHAFGEENLHHHAPIVMNVSRIEVLPRK